MEVVVVMQEEVDQVRHSLTILLRCVVLTDPSSVPSLLATLSLRSLAHLPLLYVPHSQPPLGSPHWQQQRPRVPSTLRSARRSLMQGALWVPSTALWARG